MTPDEKLAALGITLPEAPAPLGAYVPCIRTGNLLFLSGMLPLRAGKLSRTGNVGAVLTVPEAQEEARQVVINALAVVKNHAGSLNAIKQCVKIIGYVASSSDFTEQPKVLNAASELLVEILGEAGRHARAALG